MMEYNPQADTGEPLWTITSISDATRFDPAAGIQQVKRIEFRTMDGARSFVDVAVKDFTPDKVNDAVHAAAVNLIQVMALQGPTVPPQQQSG